MAHFKIDDISVRGIVSCVPPNKVDNLEDINIEKEHAEKIITSTGIRYRRITEESVTSSDLCEAAARSLIEDLQIDPSEIEILIFVTQTPDFILPATATLLQDRLGLSNATMAFDINMGCSGYVYGLSVVASLLANVPGDNGKGLLLVGDTISKVANPKDLSTYPLFGDAGSATLVEKKKGKSISFDLFTDGKGASAIEITHGGFRNPYDTSVSDEITRDGVNFHRKTDLYLNGMDVFSFGITRIPKAIKAFCEKEELQDSDIDFYIFHQANKFMNEKIRKKIGATEEKVPYTLHDFANVSSATIPLTITQSMAERHTGSNILCCGFGVGLSWGIAYFKLDRDVLLKTIAL